VRSTWLRQLTYLASPRVSRRSFPGEEDTPSPAGPRRRLSPVRRLYRSAHPSSSVPHGSTVAQIARFGCAVHHDLIHRQQGPLSKPTAAAPLGGGNWSSWESANALHSGRPY
jgi:hypothetical protein